MNVSVRAADTTACDCMRVSVAYDARQSLAPTFQEEIVLAALRDRHLLNLEFLRLDEHALLSDRYRDGMTFVLTAL